jgi:hypothetical protein
LLFILQVEILSKEMEKKGDHFDILKTEDIRILKEQLCQLKHSGKYLKESLQNAFYRQQNQQSQLSGNSWSLTNGELLELRLLESSFLSRFQLNP